jgi:hypothetical protein
MDEGREGGRGSRSGALLAAVLAAVAAVVLLAIAAAGSGASPFGPGAAAGRASPPDSVVWGLLGTLAVLGLATAVAVIVLAIIWREQVELPVRSRWRIGGILLLFGLVVAAMLLRSARGRLPSWLPLGSPGDAPGGGEAVPGARPDSAGWLPLAVAVVGLLVWIGVAVLAARRGRREGAEPSEAERLAELVEEALLGLAAETDPRRAVIAAYDVMERGLAAAGTPRLPGETPREHTTRTLLGAHAPAPPVTTLAELFERARFSPHEIDAAMRDQALAALDEVRTALRARAAAEARADPPSPVSTNGRAPA